MTQPRRVMGTWHPRVNVNAVEFDNEPTHGLAFGADEADTTRFVSDDMSMLIRKHEMCWRCLQEFPVSMASGERFSRWAEAIDRGQFRLGGPITRQLVLDRALARVCPMCAAPITDGYIETQVKRGVEEQAE
jgi:hypothetical protein